MGKKRIDRLISNGFKKSGRLMPAFKSALETMNDFLDGRSEDRKKGEAARKLIENFYKIKRQEIKNISRMIATLVKQDKRKPMAKRIFA